MSDDGGVGRLAAFSDGVFAVAVTLLVFDIKVPPLDQTEDGRTLLGALLGQWPNYLALAISFVTILIMWINHHAIMKWVPRADHWLLVLNGLFLLSVTIVPFPTALLAAYVRHDGQQIAAAVYTGTFIAIGITFNLLWLHVAWFGRLLDPRVNRGAVRRITRLFAIGSVLYLVAFLLAFVSVLASVGLCLLLALVFALPSPLARRQALGAPDRASAAAERTC
jgi:uncharacterized membrane protein